MGGEAMVDGLEGGPWAPLIITEEVHHVPIHQWSLLLGNPYDPYKNRLRYQEHHHETLFGVD